MSKTDTNGIRTHSQQGTASDSLTNSDSAYKIAVRFGDRVLEAGFTSVPNLVLNHYAELGVTPAEMLFTIHMWQFRWTERDPYPSLTTIAAKMNVSWRQAHRYANSLKQKGLLAIKTRQQSGRGQVTSEYDFEPFIRAVLNLEKAVPTSKETHAPTTPLTKMTEGGLTNLTEGPLTEMSEEEYKEQEYEVKEDVNHSNIRKAMPKKGIREVTRKQVIVQPNLPQSSKSGDFQAIGTILKKTNSAIVADKLPTPQEHQVIQAYVESFASDLADRASLASSTARALNLFRRSSLSLESFIRHMYNARSVTKERSLNATMASTPSKARPAKRKMAYFFACLEDNLGLRATSENTISAVQQTS
jgi:hypothetical protein